jgi:ubiquitin-like-conjugating enzyme ATG3
MWLSGYDEHKAPLPPALVFQDISSDYAQKTVTVEAFPNLAGVQMATVHPCKHAHVMKKVIDRVNAGVVEAQKREGGALSPSGSVKDAKKRGWGVGGLVNKVAGGSSAKKEKEGAADGEEVVEGLRVDQCALPTTFQC